MIPPGTKIASIGDLTLVSGVVLPNVEIAYVTTGTLAADGRNAVLLTHGYTSSHFIAGSSEGPWDAMVGPGRAIDTNRFFVVSSNMLGSSYGSTSPASRNPATNRAYGPDFPIFTVQDIVTAQHRMLTGLGVTHLAAVVGPSYGGFQAFQWAVTFPDFMDAIVPVVSAPNRPNEGDMAALEARLATDPNWNGGHYYEAGGIAQVMAQIRFDTLLRYGMLDELADRMPNPADREAEVRRRAAAWAEEFDGHSLLTLGSAANRYGIGQDMSRIKARVLYVLSRTDLIFPPSLAPGVMADLKAAGIDAEYFEIDSEHGHLASGTDAAKWEPTLRRFMATL